MMMLVSSKLVFLGFVVLFLSSSHAHAQEEEQQQRQIRKRRNLATSSFFDPQTTTGKTIDNISDRVSGIADGCYHVYLDVGSNIGVHARFLYESHLYPHAKKAAKVFDTYFGSPSDRNNNDICIFAFEPNPAHRERLELLEKIYNNAGWKFHVYMVGVGVSDNTKLTFYHQPNEIQDSEWGFGTTARHDQNSIPVDVPVMDLTHWIETEIMYRKIPTSVHGKYENGPKVVMKVDIEGQEFVVVPKLMFSNVLCRTVDYVFTEDHPGLFQFTRDPTLTNLGIQNEDDAQVYWNNLISAFNTYKQSSRCRTTIEMLDDETYHTDGVEGGLIPVQ